MVLSTQEVVIHPLGTSQAFHFYALHGSCSMNTSPPFFFCNTSQKVQFGRGGCGGGVLGLALSTTKVRFCNGFVHLCAIVFF